MTPDRKPPVGLSTLSVHGGETRPKPDFSMTPPVVFSSTFTFTTTQDRIDHAEGRVNRGEEYGRYGNPTQSTVENKLAVLEGGESALLFSTGMAAVTTTLLAILGKGAHVVFTSDCYRKTRQFATDVLPRLGFEHSLVAPDVSAVEQAIRANTQALFTESPTNPYLNVIDLESFAALGRKRGLTTIIDSTFATPFNQRPIELGIDLVIHSATKYLGGHNDLLAGCVVGGRDIVATIKEFQGVLGPVPEPMSCYLLARGLKTLALRMERHNTNAQSIAAHLARHPKIERVHYPGLSDHPRHALARRQMRGFGGVISFEVRGDGLKTSRFIDAMRIPQIAPSLGGVESLIEQPALMSFYHMAPEERRSIGILDNLVRFAIGIEDADDLIADLDQALARL
ncbi:MAG: PLP-dependent transferase [Vicinamibacteria bacterium]|nr:PLP-dependent transferase [Vicinamibacteria bacterium]